MNLKGFVRAGNWRTLLAAFLYFDVSFMAWVMLGPLAPFLSETLHLSPSEKGFLIAAPLLAGSLFRPLLGALADRIGGRIAGLVGLSTTLTALGLGWLYARSLSEFMLVGLLLGISGASFAVALPLASRWYPPEYQGLAMGIAGAGNSGTLLATLFAPRIAAEYGWDKAFGLAMIPICAVLVLFFFLAKDHPSPRKAIGIREYRALLAEPDTAWFCFFYSITFGGFVGLASFLTLFFHEQYGLTKVQAGDFTTAVVLCGSFVRPVGGWFADRVGGYKLLLAVLLVASVCLATMATLPSLPVAVALLAFTMALFGIGNGAIFQLVPQRFESSVGVITGLVGAAGGIGGFFLPSIFGVLKQATASYSAGLLVFALVVAAGFLRLLTIGASWLRLWPQSLSARAGLFSVSDLLAAKGDEA